MYLLGVLFVGCALGAVNVAAGGARTAQKAVPTGMFLTGKFKEGPQFQMNLRWGAAATSKASTKSTGVEGEYWYLDSTSSYTLELSGTVLPDGSFRITETEVRVPYTGRGGDDNARETGSFRGVFTPDRSIAMGVWSNGTKQLAFRLSRVSRYLMTMVKPRDPTLEVTLPDLALGAHVEALRQAVYDCDFDKECRNDVEIAYHSPQAISLLITQWGYNEDTPHGRWNYQTLNLVRSKSNKTAFDRVTLKDFIAPKTLCARRIWGAINTVLVQHGRGMQGSGDPTESDSEDAYADMSGMAFVPRPTGLIFYFGRYELGSYADGGYHIFVPWNALGDCMTQQLFRGG
jgi:hypothetical protein